VSGATTASTTARCVGTSGSTCKIAVALSVTETLRRGKVVAVTSTAKGGPTTTTKAISVGTTTVTLDAGESERITVRLDRHGRNLLKIRGVLVTKLVVSADGAKSALARTTIKFAEPRRRRRSSRIEPEATKLALTPHSARLLDA
jgi:hypothetical protein